MTEFARALFTVGNLGVMPCWALLILAPRARITGAIFGGGRMLPQYFLAFLYAAALIRVFAESPDALAVLAQPTIDGVQRLLGSVSGASAGWIHYLCFDLLIGAAVWRTALARGHRFLWVSPLLALTLLLGPLGWLSYELVSRCARGSCCAPQGGSGHT
ncbi:MAG: DUF4281 domain-containing protein [Proteobacteria bacterium]|nr:DUF4281 domain-containing protein [Pseudomonadota bacterium]